MMKKYDRADTIAGIAERFGLADIYVFGSRAKEIASVVSGGPNTPANPSSDVDIGIRPLRGEKISPHKIVNLAIELEDLFEANRVDIVVLNECDAYLALDIIRGELLYAKDPDDQARYELFVLRRAADLLPHKKERIKLILGGHGR